MSTPAELVASAAEPAQFPRDGLPEIAFLGRSNVGKSSLLNRLAARRALARTSHTPGRTRLLHFFRVQRGARALLLVDLPGYGYAKVARREREAWRALIEHYLHTRRELRAAVLLQDARRDPGEDEALLLAWLHERRIPVLLALTKFDKLKARERARRTQEITRALEVQADWAVPTSAKSGAGVAALWKLIEARL